MVVPETEATAELEVVIELAVANTVAAERVPETATGLGIESKSPTAARAVSNADTAPAAT